MLIVRQVSLYEDFTTLLGFNSSRSLSNASISLIDHRANLLSVEIAAKKLNVEEVSQKQVLN